jgi:acetyl-CoA decarbonylase/synthase complex subunit beta
VDKIATENEAKTLDALKDFLKAQNHPVVERWKEAPAEAEAKPEAEAAPAEEAMPTVPVATVSTLPITAGGYKIILKDAKIFAKKVIIRAIKDEKQEKR